MRVYHVSCDLHRATPSSHGGLSTAMRELGETYHLGTSWLVAFPGTAKDLADYVEPYVQLRESGPTDFILISEVTANREAWLPRRVLEWLNRHVDAAVKLPLPIDRTSEGGNIELPA